MQNMSEITGVGRGLVFIIEPGKRMWQRLAMKNAQNYFKRGLQQEQKVPTPEWNRRVCYFCCFVVRRMGGK